MKAAFDFQSRQWHCGENLTRLANFLPSAGRELPGRKNFLVAGLNYFRGFAGVFRNHAENLTMAQPLLKGELR